MSPPLVPAGESLEQPAPRGEVFPREQPEDPWATARFAGRLILQPPAGLLGGLLGGIVGFYPAVGVSLVFCGAVVHDTNITDSKCLEYALISLTAVGASVGAGLGVVAVGHLLGGRARFGATLGGALAGSVASGIIGLLSGRDLVEMSAFLLIGPVLGATLVYTLSDAYFPDPRRPIIVPKEDPEDEYAQVLPMVTTTRTGGIIGGLVGRF